MEKELKFSDGLRRSLEGSNKKYPLHNYLQQKSELARTQEILRNIEARNEKGKWLAHFRLKEKELLDALTMPPWCYQGIRRARIDAMKVPISIVILLAILLLVVGLYKEDWVLSEGLRQVITIFLVTGTFLYILPAIWTIWRRHPFPKEQLTEEILTVAGWENVTNIDLRRLKRRRIKELKKNGKSVRVMTSGWWFYYY